MTIDFCGTPQNAKRTYRPQQKTVQLWDGIRAIVRDPQFADVTFSVRQVYYQCVTRGVVKENTNAQYDRVQRAVLQMRRQGELEYHRIRDSARERTTWQEYGSIGEALEETATFYRRNLMRAQPRLVEMWIEKDSLAGFLEPIAAQYGLPYAALRGYSSESFQYDAADDWRGSDKPVVIIYAGDLDPSGRNIAENLEANLRCFYPAVTVDHIGLHPDDVREMGLPHSFEAKESDSRTPAFVRQYGAQCTELDAVPPNTLQRWYEHAVERHIDLTLWRREMAQWKREKDLLKDMVSRGLAAA